MQKLVWNSRVLFLLRMYLISWIFLQAVPQIYQNGEHFHYHIKYTQDASSEPSKFLSINSTIPFTEVGKLLRNSSYYFYIHSANEKGISQGSELIFIAPEDESKSIFCILCWETITYLLDVKGFRFIIF